MSYVVLKWCDGQAWLPAWLNPPGRAFGAKEHCCATLTGAAAAFTQSLGLSGGLAPLTLYYGHEFTLAKIFAWTFIAAFFGLFLGCLYGKPVEISAEHTFFQIERRDCIAQLRPGCSLLLSECSAVS